MLPLECAKCQNFCAKCHQNVPNATQYPING